MVRYPVSSSKLKSVGYENGILEVEFHSGGIYQYYGVPASVYNALMNASSKGGYLATMVKGHYEYSRIG